MTTISVDTVSTPTGIAAVLRRLSAGEAISFHDRDMIGRDTLAFTLERIGSTYVIRDQRGQTLSSAPSFAEAWRRRPRSTDTPKLGR